MVTKANQSTQDTESKFGTPENPSLLPGGILPTDQIAVVEKDSPGSGYLISRGTGRNTTGYLVQEGSALAGPPWNVPVGTAQGGYANPPMSDDLLREIGLSREEFEKLGDTLETKDAVEGAAPTPEGFDPDAASDTKTAKGDKITKL